MDFPVSYIKWLHDTQSGRKDLLDPVLREVTRRFEDDMNYKNAQQYINFWILFVRSGHCG